MGEFLALAASLEHLANRADMPRAAVLAEALDKATGEFLNENKSPSRKVNELDNRGSHFYLALFWAEALAEQNKDEELKTKFEGVAVELRQAEVKIIEELNSAQGVTADVGGYYKPDPGLASNAMRPSPTFNEILSNL